MINNTITWTPALLKRFKREYAHAVETKKEVFIFNDGVKDHELLTSYAKYLIEYLDSQFSK